MSPAEKERLAFIEKQKRDLEEVPFLPSMVAKKKRWLDIVDFYKNRSEGQAKEIFEAEQLLAEALGYIDHEGLVGPPGSVVCPFSLWEIAFIAARALKGIEGNMKFTPMNRRLHVRRVGINSSRKQKKQDGVVLPDNVEFEKKGRELYAVVSKADDVKLKVAPGDYIIVEPSMVEVDRYVVTNKEEGGQDIEIMTVQENYVKGVVTSWEEEDEKETT